MYKVVVMRGGIAGEVLMIAPLPTLQAVLALRKETMERIEMMKQEGGHCDLFLNRSPLYVASEEITAVRVSEAEAIELI